MSNRKDEIIEEIADLLKTGRLILAHEAIEKNRIDAEQQKDFSKGKNYIEFVKSFVSLKYSYQQWYSKALPVIRQILPDRYQEFLGYYNSEEKRKDIDFINYSISDYLLGLQVTRGEFKAEIVDRFAAFYSKFENQISILDTAIERISSSLSDIEGILQSELFENELAAAKDLLKKKHIRASGTLVGVTIESHLKKVCANHGITFRKKNLSIADYNDALKSKDVLDLSTWRLIQRLGDIRNLSAHPKERDPTGDEIEDLIRGCEKIIAEII